MLPAPPLNLLPTCTARRSRAAGKTYFLDAAGQQFPSVTSILQATKPWQDRQALAQWRSRVGHTEAARISQTASRRGTQTHRRIQQFLRGEAGADVPPTDPYWQSVEPILAEIEMVRLVEGTVFHPDLQYAGRVDCVVQYRQTLCLVDWKTADRPKETVDRLYDHPLQLAAYCGALNQTYSAQGIHLTQAAVVVAIAAQPAEVFWFDAELLRSYWHQWLERLAEFGAMR